MSVTLDVRSSEIEASWEQSGEKETAFTALECLMVKITSPEVRLVTRAVLSPDPVAIYLPSRENFAVHMMFKWYILRTKMLFLILSEFSIAVEGESAGELLLKLLLGISDGFSN